MKSMKGKRKGKEEGFALLLVQYISSIITVVVIIGLVITLLQWVLIPQNPRLTTCM